MKIAMIIVRTLMGLMFLFASITVLFKLMPQPELHGDVKTFTMGMAVTGYFFPFLKITELICGIAFVTGRFVTLAAVVIFPIIINILLFHAFMAPEGLLVAILLLLGDLFLAYYYRENYRTLFKIK
ncbi:DoxX family membrane protein [Solitalea canadensis]|uniref:DoxX protein n=1 Tax=Solitalea canadensis (strain ATCC 29591 / DSM 3403 / JCM 21819 / LMG 8368 / NBRC 15130 / NCIMB 12057 / USAM 9D) TaxID=929556 RepID=H8KLV8_SOLCM|nr:DoxX family membrane protein [Solitalea canadensis]AFD08686.1 DoxX protein [Solitalea canadensis DSM 3403]